MPRKARDERLDTRTARLKLSPRREPYWRSIQEGRAIGYRRLSGQKSGSWIARHYEQAAGRRYRALGAADDFLEADGTDTLTFGQAQDRAREWFGQLGKADGKTVEPLTVRAAYEHYVIDYRARGGKAPGYVEITFNAHILPRLGDRLVTELTSEEIRRWHRELATSPPRLRTSANAATSRTRKIVPEDADGHRARRATANAILTLLKAALNLAYREGRVRSDDAWRRVQPFQKVTAARVRYLTADEASRLINACEPDLRLLVTAALLTGCRYQELARVRCADIDITPGVATIRAAKGGSPRHVVLTDEARRFFLQLIVGREPSALPLTRADGGSWGKSHQFRPLRGACTAAKISPPVSFHILRHTHASRLALKGVPMAVIAAQLGHSDVKLTHKHYAHLSPGYVADTIRDAFGSLGVLPLRPAS